LLYVEVSALGGGVLNLERYSLRADFAWVRWETIEDPPKPLVPPVPVLNVPELGVEENLTPLELVLLGFGVEGFELEKTPPPPPVLDREEEDPQLLEREPPLHPPKLLRPPLLNPPPPRPPPPPPRASTVSE
jgi:hypothetical protein